MSNVVLRERLCPECDGGRYFDASHSASKRCENCKGTGKVSSPGDEQALALPTDAAKRKAIPLVAGCLDYFPAALQAVAELSRVGNEQHNLGQPMHHARGKSSDHADCIVRHLMDRGAVDTDGIRHSAKAAWRALALLQEELERDAGAPIARGARVQTTTFELPTITFTPKHAATCKDSNCDRSCMKSLHCKACGSVTPSGCVDCR